MSRLSIDENRLILDLDEEHRIPLILSFLRRSGFREINPGRFVNRRTDARTIRRTLDYFELRRITLERDPSIELVLREDDDVHRNIQELFDRAAEIKNRPDEDFEDLVIPEFLPEISDQFLQYQKKPVLHGLTLKNSANFSVPGSGKTWMAYATYFMAKVDQEPPRVNRLLVVCPIAGFQVWEEEYETVTGRRAADHVVRLTNHHRDNNLIGMLPRDREIILVNYDKIYDQRFHAGLQTMMMSTEYDFYMILDESHRAKNFAGETGEAVRGLAPHAKRRMILTGTPMPNYHIGLWNQFHFLFPNGEHDLGNDPIRFLNRCPPPPNRNPREEARVELTLNPLFTRITDRQLGLPEPDVIPLICPMDQYQTEIYETIAWDIFQNHENAERFRAYGDFERNMTYLIMAATDPSLLGDDQEYMTELIDLGNVELANRIRDYHAGELSGKLDVLLNHLRTIIPGEKIIIWCNFRGTLVKVKQMIEHEFGVEVRKIDGTVDKDDAQNPLDNREKSLREFKTLDSGVDVLVANPASLAESVSLHQACQHAIYVDRTFVANNWIQSKKRIHRIGMVNQPRYTILKCSYGPNDPRVTIDSVVDANLRQKEDAMNDFLTDPGLNVNEMELNYNAIRHVNEVRDDFQDIIRYLQEKFGNVQNN